MVESLIETAHFSTGVVRQLLKNIREYSVDLNEYGDKLQLQGSLEKSESRGVIECGDAAKVKSSLGRVAGKSADVYGT